MMENKTEEPVPVIEEQPEELKKDVQALAFDKFKDIVYSILAKEERSSKNKELAEFVKTFVNQAIAESNILTLLELSP